MVGRKTEGGGGDRDMLDYSGHMTIKMWACGLMFATYPF